jgi:hypothetical protein
LKIENLTILFLIAVAIIAIVWAIIAEPISQDISYHNFSDKGTIFAIPNFWNVVTNIPFFIVGFIGLLKLKNNRKIVIAESNSNAYFLFYTGTILISFGSGFYHLNPNNETLVWDRLPMTLAFMSVFSIIITEYISIQKGKALLIPLVLAGILSVLYWNYTESLGRGDLTFYAVVQFYPMIAIPIILISFSSLFTRGNSYWLLLAAYLIAKVFEHYDSEIFNKLRFISGHSIKHLMAAFGLYMVLYVLDKREINPSREANFSA